jgi:hypothetical protein
MGTQLDRETCEALEILFDYFDPFHPGWSDPEEKGRAARAAYAAAARLWKWADKQPEYQRYQEEEHQKTILKVIGNLEKIYHHSQAKTEAPSQRETELRGQ